MKKLLLLVVALVLAAPAHAQSSYDPYNRDQYSTESLRQPQLQPQPTPYGRRYPEQSTLPVPNINSPQRQVDTSTVPLNDEGKSTYDGPDLRRRTR